MGNVIFVLAVVAFWACVFLLVMFLIRISSSSREGEQATSELSEDSYETTDTAALT
jgi:amino acid permease